MDLSRPRVFLALFIIWMSSAALAESEWSFITDVKLEALHWPQPYGENTSQSLLRWGVSPRATGILSESTRLVFAPNFQWDPANKSTEERIFFDIGEAYYRQKNESTQWQVGSHILNWGVTDGYNPLDVINPRQYYDPLHSVKLGVWSLLFSYATEASELELIYIPKNQSSILPGTNSRWLPREIYIPRSIDNNIILLLPENLHYSYKAREALNHALDNNLGLRWQWHLGAVDLGLTAFEGSSVFPLVQANVTGNVVQVSPKIVLQTDPNVVLGIKNYRQRTAGLSWVSSQWDFLFKYASAYSQSLGDDPLLPGWTHENIAGLEKNFTVGRDGLLVALLQYSFIHSQKQNDSNLSVQEIFRRAWMAGGRFSWAENWTLMAMALYDTQRYTHFQQYSLARRIQDTWTLQGSAEFFAGAADTPLGVFGNNDNYRLTLTRTF